jgi:hypothetical protein
MYVKVCSQLASLLHRIPSGGGLEYLRRSPVSRKGAQYPGV